MNYKTVDFESYFYSNKRNKIMLKRGCNKKYEQALERKAYLKALQEK